jgi:hypothetical protein
MTDSRRVLRIAAMVAFALSLILLGISFYKQFNGGRGAFGPALGGMVIAGLCYGVGRSDQRKN